MDELCRLIAKVLQVPPEVVGPETGPATQAKWDSFQVVGDRRPDVVLHLAAATDVDRCEQEPDWAHRTNAVGTETSRMPAASSKR